MGTPFQVYGSMQDHGSFRAPVDLSQGRDKIPAQKFENAPGGEGSNHAVDPTNPNILYSAGFYGTIMRSEYDKPGDFPGRPWTKSLLPTPYADEPRLRGQWLAPFILSPHDPNILYHGMQFLFRSLDRGNTWEKISPDLTWNTASEMGDIPYHTLFAISESPLRYGLIYAGTDDGRVWVTKDGGKAWTEITAGLPYQKWVSRLVASAYDLGTVYMTQNGKRDDDFTPYVWKSTDFGKTWTSIAKGIPLGPVNVIREDPVEPEHPLRRHGHGRLCDEGRREELEGPGRQPADALRPRPDHPPARQHHRHRHARPRHVGPGRQPDQRKGQAAEILLRGLTVRGADPGRQQRPDGRSSSQGSGPSASRRAGEPGGSR